MLAKDKKLYGVTADVVKNSATATNAYTSIIVQEGLWNYEQLDALSYSKDVPGRMFFWPTPQEKQEKKFYRKYHCKTYADVLAHFKMFRDAGVYVRVLPHDAPASATTTNQTAADSKETSTWGAFGAPPGELVR